MVITTTEKAVDIQNFWWRYPTFDDTSEWALKDINLQVKVGEFLGITGRSGAGKSTLCQAILGSVPHSIKIPLEEVDKHLKGAVTVLGKSITRVETDDLKHRRIAGNGIISPEVGLVMQDPETQFLRMNLYHEISFGLQLQGIDPVKIEKRINLSLERVGLGDLYPMASLIHPAELSGGQKQRVVIAAFLAMEPRILILDEPTSDLDPIGKRSVIQAIRLLREQYDLTIILVEHNPELMLEFADKIALLDDGRLLRIDSAIDFYKDAIFLEEHGVAAPDVTRVAASTNKISEVPLNISQGLEIIVPKIECRKTRAPTSNLPPEETVISVKDVWFEYPDGTVALRGANMEIQRGEYIALLGQNGCGKTTLAKILCGIYRHTRGQVMVLNTDIAKNKVRQQLPKWVGYVFQNPDHQIFLRSCLEECAFGLKNLGFKSEDIEQRSKQVLEKVGLAAKYNEDPLFLSKGERQRLAVASVTVMEPSILIVDEPTTGQDYKMCNDLMAIMDSLNQAGKTILVITHDMRLVAEHCNKVIIMENGQTIFSGTPRDFYEHEAMIRKCNLEIPSLAQLSLEARKKIPDFPYLITESEWISALEN